MQHTGVGVKCALLSQCLVWATFPSVLGGFFGLLYNQVKFRSGFAVKSVFAFLCATSAHLVDSITSEKQCELKLLVSGR